MRIIYTRYKNVQLRGSNPVYYINVITIVRTLI